MDTVFLLYHEYKTSVVLLSDISEKYFGLAPATARMRASAGKLPVPAFRSSQKSEYLVKIEDLASYIERKLEEARYRVEADLST